LRIWLTRAIQFLSFAPLPSASLGQSQPVCYNATINNGRTGL